MKFLLGLAQTLFELEISFFRDSRHCNSSIYLELHWLIEHTVFHPWVILVSAFQNSGSYSRVACIKERVLIEEIQYFL